LLLFPSTASHSTLLLQCLLSTQTLGPRHGFLLHKRNTGLEQQGQQQKQQQKQLEQQGLPVSSSMVSSSSGSELGAQPEISDLVQPAEDAAWCASMEVDQKEYREYRSVHLTKY